MLNHTFTFNGHSSDEFGIKIERFRALNRSARKYDYAAVPGRNGNLYNLQQAWNEISVSYQIWASGFNPVTNLLDLSYSSNNIVPGTDGYYIGRITSATTVTLYDAVAVTKLTRFKISGLGSQRASMYITYSTTNSDSGQVTDDDVIVTVPAGQSLTVQLIIPTGSFGGRFITTKMVSLDEVNLDAIWTDIIEWLNSADDYAQLSDTYDPDHYRYAVFVDATDIANSWNNFGRAVVTFRCRPERFLSDSADIELKNDINIGCAVTATQLYVSADTGSRVLRDMPRNEYAEILDSSGTWSHIVTADGLQGYACYTVSQDTGISGFVSQGDGDIIINNTNRIAKPKVYMSNCSSEAHFRVNTQYMEIAHSFDEVEVDCETEYVTGTPDENYNLYTTVLNDSDAGLVSTYDFPWLSPGYNYILSGGADMTIEARMWEL